MLFADGLCQGADLFSQSSNLCLDDRQCRRRRCACRRHADCCDASASSDVEDAVGHGSELVQREVSVGCDDRLDVGWQRRHPDRREDLFRKIVPGLRFQVSQVLGSRPVAHLLIRQDAFDPCCFGDREPVDQRRLQRRVPVRRWRIFQDVANVGSGGDVQRRDDVIESRVIICDLRRPEQSLNLQKPESDIFGDEWREMN